MSISAKVHNITFLNTDKYELKLNLPKDAIIINLAVEIMGFLYRKDGEPIQKIKYSAKSLFGHQVIGTAKLVKSPVFAKLHPEYKLAGEARFDSKLYTAFLQEHDNVEIIAVMKDNSEEPIVSFDIDIESDIFSSYKEKVCPIKLLSLGRTGTTLLMNMISSHPNIGINNHFNESNIISYYLNHIRYMYPTIQKNNFGEGKANIKNIAIIQKNDFMEFPFISDDDWYSYLYPKKLASFVKGTIDDYYLNASGDDINYSIEKGVVHDPSLTLMDQLYVNSKYIFLVRDFRDMYASIIDFNKKRGFKAFGMENYETNEEYIIALGNYCNNSFITAYESIKDNAMLVKYEDLVTNKEKVLKSIFEYLEVDSSDILVDKIIALTSGNSKNEKKHMTTINVAKSIGKYKDILDKDTIGLVTNNFEKSLHYFGYMKEGKL